MALDLIPSLRCSIVHKDLYRKPNFDALIIVFFCNKIKLDYCISQEKMSRVFEAEPGISFISYILGESLAAVRRKVKHMKMQKNDEEKL